MTERLLPHAEWSRLAHTEAAQVWQHLSPDETQIFVVEDQGEIVASWLVVRIVHAECVWIAPAYRGSFGVVKRLLRGMRQMASRWGVSSVMTSAVTDDVRELIGRLGGTVLPGHAFTLPLGEK